MASISSNTNGTSGNWTAGGSWVGGIAPQDNDTVTITAGHTIVFDDDHSTYVNGISTLTVNGTLNFDTSKSVCLAIKTGTSFTGGTGGKINIGTSRSTPYPKEYKALILLLGTATFGPGVAANIFCKEPTYKYARITVAVSSGTSLTVDTDLTGEEAATNYWKAGQFVWLCGARSTGLIKQRLTISSVTSTTINVVETITGGTFAVGSFVALCDRNVEVKAAKTSGGAISPAYSGTLDLWVHPVASTAGSASGYLTYNNSSALIGGVIEGWGYGFSNTYGATLDGVSMAGSNCLYYSQILNNGVILGYNSVNGGGTLTNSSTGIISCNYILSAGRYDNFGKIVACQYTVSDAFIYNGYQGSQLGGSGADENGWDIYHYSPVRLYGTDMYSTNKITPASYNTNGPDYYAIFVYDYPSSMGGQPQLGYYKGWSRGGTMTTITSSIPASPPRTLSKCYKMLFNLKALMYFDIPLFCQAGRTITATVYIIKSANSFSEIPKLQLVDMTKHFDDSTGVLATVSMDDNTSWQTLTLKYTPTVNTFLYFRVRGTCAAVNDTLHWYPDYSIQGGILANLGTGG